jgi:alpha-mannosidase
MRLVGTERFVGTAEEPLQVVRVDGLPSGPVEVGVQTQGPPGTVETVTVVVDGQSVTGDVVVAEPGWTVWMVSHFHYDPVWWNTQAAYTTTWGAPGQTGAEFRGDFQRTGFDLVQLHMETARREPEYKFVLAELDYLKPYWDQHPRDRAYLRQLLREGRLELMGGTYNEPNTNLTTAETTIRNLVYGVGYQRDVLGGDPRTAWQLDAFGHDPQFPGLVAAAGLDSSSWARGPFHQWGPMQWTHHPGDGWGDPSTMQFPAEFEWLSPSGTGVLTHYMPAHYGAGWHIDAQPSLEAAEENVYELFLLLKKVASTRNVLLPVGTDYTPPARWVVDIHRDWNSRYVWPRMICALPREFFAAVRSEAPVFSPQTRDMNPIYTGKDVSFIDTKQAQRHTEALLTDAEAFATVAALGGAPYPHEAVDLAWRQLAYGAHHDGITGSESDQVYLDLLTGWREAYDLASGVLDNALFSLCTALPSTSDGPPRVVVFNPTAWTRTDVVRVDGVDFVADEVPSLGYKTFDVPAANVWQAVDGASIENETFRVEVDPARGGTVSSWLARREGRELLQAGRVGNELLIYDEYPAHPKVHEGPWHLLPKGPPVAGSSSSEAEVQVEHSALGQRVTVKGAVGPATYTQTLTLWNGSDRLDAVTHLDSFTGEDQLVRLRWPADVPGALPVSEVGNAVVGRGFGIIDVDSDPAPYTLDNPANHWFALSSTARIKAGDHVRAIGVAEVIGTDVRELAVALVRQGVTATCSVPTGPRYGLLALDSNLPDVRIAVGGPDENPFTRAVLESAGLLDEAAKAAPGRLRLWVPAARPLPEVWQPNADLTDVRALPVLIVDDAAALAADLAAGTVHLEQSTVEDPDPSLDDYTVGIVNRGMPGFAVDSGGALHLSLLRSCTGWPSGVWIDPPRRTAPDGSNFQQQHWTHSFEYSLVAGPGDWRGAGLVTAGHEVNHPMHARVAGPGPAVEQSFVRVEPAKQVVLTAFKPAGNPLAAGRLPEESVERVTARLYEATGQPAACSVRLHVPVRGVTVADLLETPGDGDALVLQGAGIGQLQLTVAPVPAEPAAPSEEIAYAKYWLHNTGPAPAGNLPVTVHIDPPHATVGSGPDGGPVTLTVHVASSYTADMADGSLNILVPDGWSASPSRLPYAVEPGGFVEHRVVVTPPESAAGGVYWVRARISHGVEDVARLLIGSVDGMAAPETVEVDVSPAALRLRPGDEATLDLRLRTDAASPITVHAHVISPWHTWDLVESPALAVEVAGEQTVRIPVRVPAGQRPGRWWIVVRTAHAGQLYYTEPVELEVLA